jgi:uncharacterized protein
MVTGTRIEALHVYPVKSCRGLSVARARVDVEGLAVDAADGPSDREFMVVDGAGRFVTQRDCARLALIGIELIGDTLVLVDPDGRRLRVPLAAPPPAARPAEVTVWRDTVRAYDTGDEAAAFVGAAIGMPVRLVRFDRDVHRRCNAEYVGDSGARTRFADGYPVLVIGEATLAELNQRLAAKDSPALPMNRFRPNLVISGLPPGDEDHLDTIEAGGIVLRLVKPCTRCVITTTDQGTGERGIEPLPTLAAYRHDARFGGVTFGMNAVVVAGAGRTLAAGMPAICSYRF